MADLLDIAPSTACESVHLNDGMHLVVRGLSGPAIAKIAVRFPQLVSLLGGKPENIGWHLIEHAGNAIGPIIAAGCGHLDDEEAETRAANLLVDDQLKLILAIWSLSFPNGLNTVIQALTSLMTGNVEEKKPIKVRLKKSPSPSPPSSDAASLPTMQ